ncbi:hypothetical protein DFH27DRAFT_207317 [Peziza echinospora]|nr:hypothetical protein DFH27DRAFT_207317 [Peziza echinospora]
MTERKILITSADGQTGHLAAELLLTDEKIKTKHTGLTLLTSNPSKVEDLKAHGATVTEVDYDTSSAEDIAKILKDSGANTVYLIPPAHKSKVEIVEKLVKATKEAGIANLLFLSSAGCDLAEKEKQPRLREFVHMEALVMECKGDHSTKAGYSPAIIRSGFYAENLLLYNKQAQSSGKLPLPIGENHKFAPVALGDLAHLAAVILTSKGPHGFSDALRGQLITLTGPQLCSGPDLATSASQSLNTPMEYESLTADSAKEILAKQTDIDDSEKEYLLEYYSLVRDGKTNYVSTLAFKQATGNDPTLPSEFFESYESEFKPKKRKTEVAAVPSAGAAGEAAKTTTGTGEKTEKTTTTSSEKAEKAAHPAAGKTGKTKASKK